MPHRRTALLRGLSREREAEIEYGLKEFLQGLLIGIILGFLIAMAFL